jgi:imidazolonepropionase-like amidohydrolase
VRLGVASAGAVMVALVTTTLWPPQAAVPSPSERILDHVTLMTPGVGHLRNQRLVVAEGRIESIEPSAASDTAQRYVLPGLIDMHVHLPPRLAPGLVDLFGLLFLAHGVTTVREVGSLDDQGFEVARQFANGERAGPRVFGCGRILDGDPPAFPIARVVQREAAAAPAARELAARGASCIKVYEGISAAALAGIVRAAKAARLPVVGHLTSALPLTEQALDDVQHVCFPRCESATPEEIEEFVRASAQRGMANTPTLVVFEGQAILAGAGDTTGRGLPYDLMPAFWRETLWRPIARHGNSNLLASMQELVRRLHARGVRIYAGTDPIQPFVVPGASLHRELRLLIDSGLSIEEALAAATWVAGDSLGVSGLGKLEVGAPADLLVLREDPTRDLDALTTIEEVIAGGRVYSVESLRRELAQARAHLDQPMVDLPLRAAARIGFAIASRSWNREHSEDQP